MESVLTLPRYHIMIIVHWIKIEQTPQHVKQDAACDISDIMV